MVAEAPAGRDEEPPDDGVEQGGTAGDGAGAAFAGIAAEAFQRALSGLLPGDPELVLDLLRDLAAREI